MDLCSLLTYKCLSHNLSLPLSLSMSLSLSFSLQQLRWTAMGRVGFPTSWTIHRGRCPSSTSTVPCLSPTKVGGVRLCSPLVLFSPLPLFSILLSCLFQLWVILGVRLMTWKHFPVSQHNINRVIHGGKHRTSWEQRPTSGFIPQGGELHTHRCELDLKQPLVYHQMWCCLSLRPSISKNSL